MKIWLPASTTKVTIENGKVKVWDEIEMALRPIKQDAGFGK